jgi:hypothetical protein
MNTSILNYPGFQTLPKGTRQMLLFSETHFFNQQASHPTAQKGAAQEGRTHQALKIFLTNLSIASGVASDAPA